MAVKTDGATIKRYLADEGAEAWPKETYYEEEEILVNGAATDMDFDLSLVDDAALVEIKGGAVLMGGDPEKCIAMTTHFKRWLRRQNTVMLLVEVSKEYEASLRNAIPAHNGKVLS
jgi:hypothetical protein